MLIKKMVEYPNGPPVSVNGVSITFFSKEFFCIHFELMLGLAVWRPSRVKF